MATQRFQIGHDAGDRPLGPLAGIRRHCSVSLATLHWRVMSPFTRIAVAAVLAAPLFAAGGCSTTTNPGAQTRRPPAGANSPSPVSGTSGEQTHLAKLLRARDNSSTAAPAKPGSQTNAAPGAKQSTSASPGSPSAATPATAATSATTRPAAPPSPQYTVAGMVGQVNGQALYAANVFKPMSAQLQALANQLSRSKFYKRARQLIQSRLEQMVADRLILGRASRDLSQGERRGLDHYVQEHRQMLIRKYGQGSLPIAKLQIKQQTGKTLDQALRDFRDSVIVGRYLHQKLLPRINVTRRGVRRYYHNHYQQFNPPTERTLRLIRVDTIAAAKKVKQMLDSGQSFKAVANNPLNDYNADNGGMMGQQQGDHVFKGQLNAAMLKLKPGHYDGPISFDGYQWFIYLQKLVKPKRHSLRDVQLQIEGELRAEQFRTLSTEYRQKLFKHGSYNSIPQMTSELLKIAMNRYAPPPS